ncbi:MAG: metal ABC transporter ATP-binding protein, partial [Acidobacteriota bacterium]
MKSPVVEIRDLYLSLKGVPVLEAVNLTLEEGDYLGLIGPNGGGKTTLLKVVLGLAEPDRGTVQVFGEPPARARGRIGYVPQCAGFDADFPVSVLDVVLMGRLGSPRLGRRLTGDDRRVALEALEKVEMIEHTRRQIGRLSGGQLQRVLFARALALEPRLLLLDEPTASVDSRAGRGIYELLGELSRELTVVL